MKKKMCRLTINGSTYQMSDPEALSFVEEQDLTDEQKERVRKNTGVAGMATPDGGEIFNDYAKNNAGYHAAAFGSENKAPGMAAFAAGSKVGRSGAPKDTDPKFNHDKDWRYCEAIGPSSAAFGRGAVAYSIASKSFGYRTQTGYPPSPEEAEKRTYWVDADGNTVDEDNPAAVEMKRDVVVKLGTNGEIEYPANGGAQAAVAIGADTAALANNAFATGYKTRAYAAQATTLGTQTEASGICAIAAGHTTKALGGSAFSGGYKSEAHGAYSFAMGDTAIAKGTAACALGYRVSANGTGKMVVGKLNIDDPNALFIVGNGTSTANGNAFTVWNNGNALLAGSLSTQNNADYAEMFEWKDGNPNAEDRIGCLVALDGEKIRLAHPGDEILGVISGTASLIGDSADMHWKNKYVTDAFGRIQYDLVEEFDDVEDPEKLEITRVSRGFFKHPRLNPEYDPDAEYIPREERAEWDKVGLMGKLYVRDNGTCVAGGYGCPGADGILTRSETPTNIRIMKRTGENIVWVLIK